MKKFLVPVTWMVSTYVEVEAEDIDEAVHEAHGVDLDLMPDPEYVGDSFEVDYDGVYEVPTKDAEAGDFTTWEKIPGGF